ncbi:DUF29 domain-containing protein [Nodosilinea sp. LEGE 07298]|uniref:DUF29 domain-containing protein n=1 Tax=Nodosilinea sp. LEGE 07298 TaxID=2777970 RepID=UPI00187F5390|nr:DUF29 domain-containing protein [Nodosilinea sp. LEGE 07298]MBE9113161.1 DUF29 domain-containing protein [Nodosilinea sp. LEGE 07298]
MTIKTSDATTQVNAPSLYDTDFLLWIETTATLLKNRRFDNLDLDNLIEEIESLGRSDRRAILSYLARLCEHLLKLKYWDAERQRCLRGWTIEVNNFRKEIHRLLKDSPSLNPDLLENFQTEYQDARDNVLIASGSAPNLIPEEPCFSLEQALEKDWLPLAGSPDQ